MLSEEEKQKLMDETKKKAEIFWKEVDAIPEEKKKPFPHPEKFSFPIGLDDEGNPFPVDN